MPRDMHAAQFRPFLTDRCPVEGITLMKTIIPCIPFLLLLGCDRQTTTTHKPPLDRWTGAEVTVLFKRDQLGAAGNPIAPTSTWLNNTKISLGGRIISAHEDGIFFESRYKMNSGDTETRHSIFWIPGDSILAIEKPQ